MSNWEAILRYDAITPLLSTHNEALAYFSRRDLLGEKAGSIERLWELPAVSRLLRRQQEDGSWKYAGGDPAIRSSEHYNQLETYRILGILVEKYGLARQHQACQAAADFLFRFQTPEGDFRGIYGHQYTPNYTGGIMEILIKAGYEDDARIEKGFDWLLSIRQESGGWAIPLQTVGAKFDREVMHAPTLQPDLSKPSSHMTTGCVLRAFAAHGEYRRAMEARKAGKYLASRFFKTHEYPGRKAVSFWTSFCYPFWFTDLLSALDSLTQLGLTTENPHIREALRWFIEQQQEDGTWNVKLLRAGGDKDLVLWISLGICRVVRRLCNQSLTGE